MKVNVSYRFLQLFNSYMFWHPTTCQILQLLKSYNFWNPTDLRGMIRILHYFLDWVLKSWIFSNSYRFLGIISTTFHFLQLFTSYNFSIPTTLQPFFKSCVICWQFPKVISHSQLKLWIFSKIYNFFGNSYNFWIPTTFFQIGAGGRGGDGSPTNIFVAA